MHTTPAALHLLAGGPGSDPAHLTRLLANALHTHTAAAPSVAYVGAASADNTPFRLRITRLLHAAGACTVREAPSSGSARDTAAAQDALDAADVVFISGGDVEAGMQRLTAAGLVPALQQARARGKPFIGLSAGSIMLGRAWLAWRDPDDDATAQPFDCLAFAPFVCDTHAEESDWDELHALLARLPDGTCGCAIPAPSMLRVHADGRVEALGGAVAVYTRHNGTILADSIAAGEVRLIGPERPGRSGRD